MTPLRIYLADLTHVGSGQAATQAFPLNIGLIASYAKKVYGNDIDVSLFKFPDELKEALIAKPPQILGLSNYVWNSNLSYRFCEMAKEEFTGITTVMGGTNYPFDADNQRKFLEARPCLDMHMFYEGEVAFVNVVANHGNPKFMWDWAREYPRISDLDSIPSPYATGLLDKFFAQGFTPLLETARGCPFRCNFCNAGDAYFNKVNKFSDEYVREEFTYVAKKCKEYGITHMTLADNNFGMIPRDRQTAELLYELQKDYGWPKTISAWTGKNAKERVIEITRRLGSTLSISMSVQSLNSSVLASINRENIRISDYRDIAQELNAQGRPQHAEVIMPLPGETYQSHIDGLNQLLDSGVSRVLSHTLQALHGTPYKDDPEYREKHGLVSKWRVVPLDFSTIDGKPVFDAEEVIVATNTFSFSDYCWARRYAFLIDVLHNSEAFRPLQTYLSTVGLKNSTWVASLAEHIFGIKESINRVLSSFRRETQSELFDSEAELIAFYAKPENYHKLKSYDAGGNVLFKHRLMMTSTTDWAPTVYWLTQCMSEVDSEEVRRIRDAEQTAGFIGVRDMASAVRDIQRNAGRPGWSAL